MRPSVRFFQPIAIVALSVATTSFPFHAFADAERAREEAARLLEAIDVKPQIERVKKNFFEPQISQDKQFEHYQLAIEPFYERYMSYESVKDNLIRMLTSEFSEQELKQAADFYNSPLGKKLETKIPEFRGKINSIIFNAGHEHLPELKAMIREQLKYTAPDLSVEQDDSPESASPESPDASSGLDL